MREARDGDLEELMMMMMELEELTIGDDANQNKNGRTVIVLKKITILNLGL